MNCETRVMYKDLQNRKFREISLCTAAATEVIQR
jgi:hypothetical protein